MKTTLYTGWWRRSMIDTSHMHINRSNFDVSVLGFFFYIIHHGN